jgi:hypothetical protein
MMTFFTDWRILMHLICPFVQRNEERRENGTR